MFAVLIIAIVAVGYIVSTRLHPLRACPACSSSGRHFGGVYKNAHRRSGGGPATGRKNRVATKVFWGGTNKTGIFRKKYPARGCPPPRDPAGPAARPPHLPTPHAVHA